MLPHAVAVAPDVDDVAVVEQPVDERGGHDLVAEEVPALLEALVGGEDGGGDPCARHWQAERCRARIQLLRTLLRAAVSGLLCSGEWLSSSRSTSVARIPNLILPPSQLMYEAIRAALASDDFSLIEQFEVPGRAARHGPIPPFLFGSAVGNYIRDAFKSPPWRHQTDALTALGHGENVVVSTGTASGKSLIFRALAFHKLLEAPDSRIAVFYPLKALAADQIDGWQKMAVDLGLGANIIGRIDGSVPVQMREQVLRDARIVVMTPDVCHAWFMSRLSLPIVRTFLRQLSTVVLDEAHTLEGVFGSSFAFLVRRMMAARNHLLREQPIIRPLQIVAATATIADPGKHLKRLTGKDYLVVDHDADGSPRHPRLVAHVGCPDRGVRTAKTLQQLLLANGRAGGFITFLDSRKGVEGLALAHADEPTPTDPDELIENAAVLPYRAGYSTHDRRLIEEKLRSGQIRGVVSTSALELGIDIPHLHVGLNIGHPPSRKAYLQRLGRVGRSAPGAFLLIAPALAFRRNGTTFQEYHDMAVEPSYLYLDNRFMQYAHSRCLSRELEALQASSATPTRVAWPIGFKDMHKIAQPGGNRPPEYDGIAMLGGDQPHYGYPLRNVGEVNFKIKVHTDAPPIGDVSHLQALRECYPGATYLHLTRAHRVVAWHTRSSSEPFIRVKQFRSLGRTRPMIDKWVNAGITPVDICASNYRAGKNGFLVECNLQITEKVTGYVNERTDTRSFYSELEQRDPNMRSYSRNFRTTGVVLCINHEWFRGLRKQVFVDRLREVFLREYSISPNDVGTAATRVSVRGHDGSSVRGRAVCVYDETYGSLRLTEKLFTDFESILSRLQKAVAVEPGETDIEPTVRRIREQADGFGRLTFEDDGTPEVKGSEYVFTPDSIVCYRLGGPVSTDVRVVQPTIMEGELRYQIEGLGDKATKRWVLASQLEPSADASSWSKALWNCETEEYEDD